MKMISAMTRVSVLTTFADPRSLERPRGLFGLSAVQIRAAGAFVAAASRRRVQAMDRDAREGPSIRSSTRGPPPGLLAYEGATAVGWCARGPRVSLERFQ